MLNEFCLNTGYNREVCDSASEWTSSWKTTGVAAALWPASALHPGEDLGSRGISLVGAAEGMAAELDALDSQARYRMTLGKSQVAVKEGLMRESSGDLAQGSPLTALGAGARLLQVVSWHD